MKKNNKNKKGNNKVFNFFCKFFAVILLLSTLTAGGFLIYFEILPIMYLSIFIVVGGLFVFGLAKILFNKKLKKWIKIITLFPTILLILICIFACFYSIGTIGFFNKIFDLGIRNDSYSVYVLKDSNYETIDELNDKIIGITKNENDKVIEKISSKIEFNMAEFDDTIDTIDSLYEKEVNAIVALDSTIELLQEEQDEYDDIKPIYTFSITTKVDTIKSDVDVSKENFVFYISGIDTSGKVDAKARSDVNILVAVNPKENKILMVNTPRDYYVTLGNIKAKDKLTHAGVYGIEESVATLENLYNVDIDYYARVNFTTFINIVEELDGIKVDVPVSFCEQTSSRTSTRKICLNKGLQVLNGEEALALTRTRHTLSGGDRSRIENQLLVLRAIIDKALSPEIIVKYNGLLDSVSDSVITNIDQKSITKLIKKQIKKNSEWSFESLTVEGTDAYNTTYSTGNSSVYVMNQKEESVLSAKKAFDKILETNKYPEETNETE